MTLKRMLARAGALAFLLMVFAMHVFAQSRTVTGKVTDSKDGSPIGNASVTIDVPDVASSSNWTSISIGLIKRGPSRSAICR